MWLLNRSLEAKLNPEVVFDRDKKYFYFAASENLNTISFRYQSLVQLTSRDVFKAYTYTSRQGKRTTFYRHCAFKGSFKIYNSIWYLEITPTYHFTSNGYLLDRFHEDRVDKIKKLEKNPAIRGQVVMWARYLTQPENLFSKPYPFLRFGDLLTFDIDVGINDVEWLDKHGKSSVEESEDDQLTSGDLWI